MIKAIRKKESVIKEVIISEAIIWMVGLALAIFVIAWPREYALDFFMMIEHMHIDRIYLGLAIIILTLIISIVIFFLLVKETRWNNHNLNLAPIELSIDQIVKTLCLFKICVKIKIQSRQLFSLLPSKQSVYSLLLLYAALCNVCFLNF